MEQSKNESESVVREMRFSAPIFACGFTVPLLIELNITNVNLTLIEIIKSKPNFVPINKGTGRPHAKMDAEDLISSLGVNGVLLRFLWFVIYEGHLDQ